jgi:hypothetical protein
MASKRKKNKQPGKNPAVFITKNNRFRIGSRFVSKETYQTEIKRQKNEDRKKKISETASKRIRGTKGTFISKDAEKLVIKAADETGLKKTDLAFLKLADSFNEFQKKTKLKEDLKLQRTNIAVYLANAWTIYRDAEDDNVPVVTKLLSGKESNLTGYAAGKYSDKIKKGILQYADEMDIKGDTQYMVTVRVKMPTKQNNYYTVDFSKITSALFNPAEFIKWYNEKYSDEEN